jgi:serine/threonine protein kinase
VDVWRRLEHPNIAKFYGVSFQLGERPAVVMEWYNNGTAKDFVEGHSFEDRLPLVGNFPDRIAAITNLMTVTRSKRPVVG